jgi:hypothetical protein
MTKRFRKRRVARIRDELRQWLRSQFGIRTQYSQQQIDAGREELGFDGVDDTLIAYTLFGADLLPAFSDSLGLTVSAEELSELAAAADESLTEMADFLAGSE